MQFLVVWVGGIGEYCDVCFGLVFGWIYYYFVGGYVVDCFGDCLVFGFFGQVDWFVVFYLVEVVLYDELVVGVGVEYLVVFQLYLVEFLQWVVGDGVDGQVWLQGLQGFVDVLIGIVCQGQGIYQVEGGSSQKMGYVYVLFLLCGW